MKVKRIVYLLLAVMLLGSCMKDMPDSLNGYTVSKGAKESGTEPTPEGKTLKASVESLSFSSYAGNQSFGITSNVSWQISCDADWVTVTESTTRGTGNGTVTVTVQQNSEIKERIASITISSTEAGSVKVSITQTGANPNLQLNKKDLSFTGAESSDSFSITSNTSWTVTSDQTWCTVSTSSGSNNATVTVNVSENKSTSLRNATITVKAGEQSQTIAVTQAGANPTLQLEKTNMAFESASGSGNFTIASNTSWTITSDQTWCTVSTSSGSNNATVSVYVSENTSTSSRSATITVESATITRTLAVTQNGATPITPPASQDRTFTVGGVTFKMVYVDGGTFTMGATSEQESDAYDNEEPAHQVTLSSYYIGETEVTQELWQAVMGSNPSNFSGSRKPVENVSWDDCQEFIRKLNSLTGQKFRLPTEAEWEYAARGGNESRGYKYSGSNTLSNVAWYWDNIPSQKSETTGYGTQNVATKSPNELGLYDMSGNVWEWCQDRFGSYSSGSQTNPTGPSSGSSRVRRGGSWGSSARGCRVSIRGYGSPGGMFNILGLRLAL